MAPSVSEGVQTVRQTKKKLGAAEKLRIARKWQAADRKNWANWREAGKEPSIEDARDLFLIGLCKDGASDDVKRVTVSRITLKASGSFDDCTSFILWDMIENASLIVNYIKVHVSAYHLLWQTAEITSERYGEVGDIHTFFINRLYTEAQEYVSGATPAKSKTTSA